MMVNEEANNIVSTIINTTEDQLNKLKLQQHNYKYDVFLCFNGNDNRFNFTSTLHNALRLKRFKIFIDEGAFKRGDRMSRDTLLKAVKVSRISIVVFSKNFLTSKDRLDELTMMHDLCFAGRDRWILPVFYGVDPAKIRHAGTSGKDSERLQKWNSVLLKSTNIFGYTSKSYKFEYKLIEDIVNKVEKLLPGRYNIFLSFSEDTRYSFTDYLYDALDREGFKTFRKESNCKENVSYQCSQSSNGAMAESKLVIVVLCKNYANSISRLDELVNILYSMKKNNQLVWPIFYKVEPTNIRYQKNSYARAMTKHEKNLKNHPNADERMKKWKSALFEVANLKGWHLKFGYEYDLVKKIAETAIKIYSP